jgi:hypothetical protein
MKIYLLVLIVSAGVDSMPKLSIVNKENYLKKIFNLSRLDVCHKYDFHKL